MEEHHTNTSEIQISFKNAHLPVFPIYVLL